MKPMPVTDSMFLALDTREHPMHVGGLALFTPPPDAGDDHLRLLREDLLRHSPVRDVFRLRPATPLHSLGYLAWTEDTDLDLDYHFRHSALPQPGRIRELLEVVSRWHSTPLDRHRPLWEIHLVEGLADGRFAFYSKIHHALLDGVSALRQLQSVLTDDPDARDCPPLWGTRRPPRDRVRPSPRPTALLRAGGRLVGDLVGMAPVAARVATEAFRDHRLTLPLEAPRTMFNVPVGGARRFAAQSWELERIGAVADAAGVPRNDVVLAMCSAALRTYLSERNELPDTSLVAMVPVSLRPRSGDATAGNRVGALLCELGTNLVDPADRLTVVHRCMSDGKRLFKDLSPTQALALSALNVAPFAVAPLPGVVTHTRPAFNVVISNIPGPRSQLYWNGARLDGLYPASVLLDGLALNITTVSSGGTLDVGITGCRRSVPHLQRLLTYLEDGLSALERAVL
ncbi:wax ester/triacylglycerol synthase family O-acyltransferase [Saccharomonospora sp. NB11]|jgi:diacylglycerol O-acyltransferase|uniref:WS/DGAT/MGAT family O-acyltransferase n=1 Tax=Saccharomonospora sp. NB11 TaxID=1642298 RepID=UPI0018D02412|nr:wax ester/triacylglycerol synthase family O-acyltransferase [Saccharomonospora sp. NB11]